MSSGLHEYGLTGQNDVSIQIFGIASHGVASLEWLWICPGNHAVDPLDFFGEFMKQKAPQFRRSVLARSVLLACGASAAVLAVQPVFAQEASLQRVEITGSAIKRIDAETIVPVTVLKMDDLKKEGITNVEQIMSLVSAAQMQTSTSQMVGSGTGGASFADLRGIGANKTLVLLNGRRIANNALDSSAPDLNMIPFAAIARVEVLRDGASALYGTDAIGGVINFITRKDFTGGTVTVSVDRPSTPGGESKGLNIGFGAGNLESDGFNVFGVFDIQKQDPVGGTQRPFNTRYPGGLSPTPFPANYYQGDANGNPTAPACTAAPYLIPDGGTGCYMTTSSFVNYTPKVDRTSGLVKGTVKLGNTAQLGLEYFASRSQINSVIAPVPYGGLYMNRVMPNGQLNPFYPGNPGSSIQTPNIPLDPLYTEPGAAAKGRLPGFLHVKWRDLATGSRQDIGINNQQRFVASVDGTAGAWDYQAAYSFNENKYQQDLAGYSNGAIITPGVLNGVINPFGPQSAAGAELIKSAALDGNLQNAKGTVNAFDARGSRELGDWMGAGRPAALAVGGEVRDEKFSQVANVAYATAVATSTGFDPETFVEGSRQVSAAYAELNVPITKSLDVTAAARYDRYSDFGNTTNPKLGFRFQPSEQMLLRGSISTGFRAPSLYELNSAQTYTNTSQLDDPVNCPNGTPLPGKPRAANCQVQFQTLNGGNKSLDAEKSRNATLGLVFAPVKDSSLGLDFWWLSVENSIGAVSATTMFGDPATFTKYFHRNAAGNLSTAAEECPDPTTCGYIDQRNQNLGGVKTNGIDLSGSYRLRTSGFGSFVIGLQSTFVADYQYQDYANGPWNQNVGLSTGGNVIFRWQHNANVTWSMGEYGAGLAVHHKTGYVDEDGSDNYVDSYTTWDMYGSWNPTKSLSLTIGVRNMFDKEPPLSYQSQTFQAGYDPRYTDPTGRTYYLRGNFTF